MTQHDNPELVKDWPIQSNLAREIIRKRGELYEVKMGVNKSQGSVKTHLPAIAFDEYEELPEKVTMVYDPSSHSILVDLPEPKNRDVVLADFFDPVSSQNAELD